MSARNLLIELALGIALGYPPPDVLYYLYRAYLNPKAPAYTQPEFVANFVSVMRRPWRRFIKTELSPVSPVEEAEAQWQHLQSLTETDRHNFLELVRAKTREEFINKWIHAREEDEPVVEAMGEAEWIAGPWARLFGGKRVD